MVLELRIFETADWNEDRDILTDTPNYESLSQSDYIWCHDPRPYNEQNLMPPDSCELGFASYAAMLAAPFSIVE